MLIAQQIHRRSSTSRLLSNSLAPTAGDLGEVRRSWCDELLSVDGITSRMASLNAPCSRSITLVLSVISRLLWVVDRVGVGSAGR